jgi:hypothetical protein
MRSISSRTAFQCARPGWRPRSRSSRQLVLDIARSLHAAARRGEARTPADYTPDPGMQAQIAALMAHPSA